MKNGDVIRVYDNPNGAGTPVELSVVLGKGAEGIVYLVKNPANPDGEFAIKVYSVAKSEEDAKNREEKISRMVEIGKENSQLRNHRRIAWPKLSVYDSTGKFIGYAMKRARGFKLDFLAHPKIREKKFPNADRKDVAQALIYLWETADFLHQNNIFIGDVNLANILCDENYEPCLIDADSFHIEGFPCPVGRPEMLPPEHLCEGKLKTVKRNRESDLFSLAILSFMCLMSRKHPYEHIGGAGLLENQKKGIFPYLTGSARPGTHGAIPLGQWHTIWSHYTYALKHLFALALKDGAKDPFKRPSPDCWTQKLNEFVSLLSRKSAGVRNSATGKPFMHSRDMLPSIRKPKNLEKIPEDELDENSEESNLDENVASGGDFDLSLADFIDNPTPRCPCALVLDTSAAMAGEKIKELNSGVQQFMQSVRDDDYSAHSVEVGIFTYGGDINCALDFCPVSEANVDVFTVGGNSAPVGMVMDMAIRSLEHQVEKYKEGGISHYRPWLVLMAGGVPTDDCDAVAARIRDKIGNKQLKVFVIYVGEGYDITALKKFAPPNREPALLSGVKFAEFFAWLTQSMAKTSESVPGITIDLPDTDGWRKG